MPTRRTFLQTLSQMPLLGAAMPAYARAQKGGDATPGVRSVYQDLDTSAFINAGEPFTIFGGAPVRPEVKAAMQLAGMQRILVMDAQKAVGARISTLLGCEAAMVTSGAAGALTLGTAACMAGGDASNVARLPDTTGMRREVIIQKAHRYSYEQAVRICGARMVEVETRQQMQAAIGSATALMLFNNRWAHRGDIRHEEFVEIGKSRGIATFIDCAADVPPVENLTRFNRMGFDLVTFSGGKGLRAPSSTGLLMGRRDLIEAALRNSAPHDITIGRGMKVNIDEIAGLLVAVELCLQEGGNSIFTSSEKTLRQMAAQIAKVSGVSTEIFHPPVSYSWPHLRIQWDETRRGLSAEQVRSRLRAGTPPIMTRTGPDPVLGLELSAWMLSDEEVPIVARRVTQALAE